MSAIHSDEYPLASLPEVIKLSRRQLRLAEHRTTMEMLRRQVEVEPNKQEINHFSELGKIWCERYVDWTPDTSSSAYRALSTTPMLSIGEKPINNRDELVG